MLTKLIAVIGPTGSGKTSLAEVLALVFNGELVSCDAKQVYRGMDIGTNKEKDLRVPQHLIDIKEPGERITVAEYQQLAYAKIDKIIAEGKLPILVGGSMLYAEAVMNGYEFSSDKKSAKQNPRFNVLKLSPLVQRGELKEKLASRTAQWMEQGLIEEVKKLIDRCVSPAWLEACGLEYKFVTKYIQGEITLEEAIEKTNTSQNQYVKRQFTWWRRHDDIHWVESQEQAEGLVREFLNH